MSRDNINFTSVTTIPGSEIINRAYNTDHQLEYLGHAVKGSSNADAVWTIRKYTYSSNQVISERIAHQAVWNDYNTAVIYN